MADTLNDDLREANKEMESLTKLAAYLATLMKVVADPVEKSKLTQQLKSARTETEALAKEINSLNDAAKRASVEGLAGIGKPIKDAAKQSATGKSFGSQIGSVDSKVSGVSSQIGGMSSSIGGTIGGAIGTAAGSINDDLREANKEMESLSLLAKELAIAMESTSDTALKKALSTQLKDARLEASKVSLEIDHLNIAAKNASNEGLAGIGKAIKGVGQSAGMGRFFGSQVGGLFGSIGGQVGGMIGAAGGAISGAKEHVAAGGSGVAAALGAAVPMAGVIASAIKTGIIDGGIFGIVADAMKSMVDKVAGYVKFSDPGRVERLDMAFEDLYAAVGSGLTPIIDMAIVVIDQLNRVVTGVMETLKPAFDQLSKMFQAIVGNTLAVWQPMLMMVAEMFTEMVTALEPIFNELIALYSDFAVQFKGLFAEIKPYLMAAFRSQIELAVSALQAFAIALRLISLMWGIRPGSAGQVPSGPQSIAARPAQMIGTEAIGEQARLTAFGSRSDLQDNTGAVQANTNALQNLTNSVSSGLGVVGGNPVGFLTGMLSVLAPRPWG